MSKSTALVFLLVCAAAVCGSRAQADVEQQQGQQEQLYAAGATRPPPVKLHEKLLDLAIISGKNAKKTIEDSKIVIDSIKSDVTGKLDELKRSEIGQKVATNKLLVSSQETVNKGLKLINDKIQSIAPAIDRKIGSPLANLHAKSLAILEEIIKEHEERFRRLEAERQLLLRRKQELIDANTTTRTDSAPEQTSKTNPEVAVPY